MFRKTIIALVAVSLSLGATACNTVKGLGRDIESVGEAGGRVIR
jgi:entericidin B